LLLNKEVFVIEVLITISFMASLLVIISAIGRGGNSNVVYCKKPTTPKPPPPYRLRKKDD